MTATATATSMILVVDDELDLAATCDRLLRRQGYRVTVAGTRQEALAALMRERPALVVADLRLPDGDGLDVVRAARSASVPIPVIVVTGFASEPSRQASLAAGASAYLPKPFSTGGFVGLVREILDRPA